MRYTLDTNAVIHYLRGRGRVGERLRGVSPADVVLSSVVAYELAVGVAKSQHPARHRAQLNAFTSVVPVVPFDVHDADEAADIRAGLEQLGTPIGPYDVLIAGMARARNLVVVTRNTAEFSRVPRLIIENWYD